MRSSTLLALSLLTAGGCSLNHIGSDEQAELVSPDLVISQAYGGGGNSGSVYKTDFVTLFNRGSEPVDLGSYGIYYASASGTFATSGMTKLNAFSLQPGQSYLVQEAAGSGGTTSITTPDQTGTLAIGAASGSIAVAPQSKAPVITDNTTWVDLVGWGGSTTKNAEGTAVGALTNAQSVTRAMGGCQDTGVNSADFTITTASPTINSTTTATPCEGIDLGDVDMAKAPPDLTVIPDMVITDAGPFTALLNEVKLHPSGTEAGQEFIELVGSGVIEPHTFVVAVSGDLGAKGGSTAGKIEYLYDLSAQPFGSNGLILIQSATATFSGAEAATHIIKDPVLNAAVISDYSESIVLVNVADKSTLTVGGQFPTTGVTIFDSIAVHAVEAGDLGVDPVIGTAILPACPSDGSTKLYPPTGVSRVYMNTTPQSAAAWYGGQYVYKSAPTDQSLTDVNVCSGAANAPATWLMTPGAQNDPSTTMLPDLYQPIVDLAGGVDFAQPVGDDFAVPSDDMSTSEIVDMAHKPTSGQDSGTTIKPGGSLSGNGSCSYGGRSTTGWTAALFVLGLATMLRRRRSA